MRGRRWHDIVSLCAMPCRSFVRVQFVYSSCMVFRIFRWFQKHKNIVSRTQHTQKAKSPGCPGTKEATEDVQASRTLPLTTSLDADPRFNRSLSGAIPISQREVRYYHKRTCGSTCSSSTATYLPNRHATLSTNCSVVRPERPAMSRVPCPYLPRHMKSGEYGSIWGEASAPEGLVQSLLEQRREVQDGLGLLLRMEVKKGMQSGQTGGVRRSRVMYR